MKPGIYHGIANEEYHAGPGVSNTTLGYFDTAPALVEWSKRAPVDEEAKPATELGSLIHTLLLEPEAFDGRYMVEPLDAPKRPTEAQLKAEKPSEAAKASIQFWTEFDLQAEMLGFTVISAEELRRAKLMRDSVLAHPTARALFEAPGHCESSYYWTDPATGLLLRCRPDKELSGEPVMVDLKTTADIDRFSSSVVEYGYLRGDAHYREGYVHTHDGEAARNLYVVVSTTRSAGRYPVRVFELDPPARVEGRKVWRKSVNGYAKCMSEGLWPGVQQLGLPSWYRPDPSDDFDD